MPLLRRAAALAAALAFAFALPAAPAAAAVLNIAVGATEPAQRAAWQALVDDFRAANADVEVHLTLTDVPSYRQSLPARLATDAAPDVFTWYAGEPTRELAEHGDLDDLGDAWKANNWWNAYPSGPATVDGRQVGLPYQTYPWGLFLRRDVLERAGLRDAPRDLSGLITACSKLRKAGFVPIALGAKDGPALAAWFDYVDLRANGFAFHDGLLAGRTAWTDPDVKRAFAMWRQLVDARCFEPAATTTDARGAEALLWAGRAGFLLSGTPVAANIPEIVRPQIEYARFPTIDSGQAPAEATPTDQLLVAARARNKADARRFLKFVATTANDARLARGLGSFPTSKLAPAAGTVLDLASYKVMSDARANRIDGFDRDVPATMAQEGFQAFAQFLVRPDDLPAILARLEAVRAVAYAGRK